MARRVPDSASIAAVHWLERLLGRKCGGSTGTNLYGALRVAEEMIDKRETGSIVTLICDSGERYLGTYFNANWAKAQQLELGPHLHAIDVFANRC